MRNSQNNKLGKSLLLTSLLSSSSLVSGGCTSHSFSQISQDNGIVVFQGRRGLFSSPKIELYLCNEATLLGEEGFFSPAPIVNYVGKKSTFVEGEPVKFVLYRVQRDYHIDENCLVDLMREGEIDINRRKVFRFSPHKAYWLGIASYNGLSRGNYTITCYRKDEEFLGKIDFQVVAPPSGEKIDRR